MTDPLLEGLPTPATRPVMLTSAEAASKAGMSVGAWRVMVCRSGGPSGSVRQGRYRMWPQQELDLWLEQRGDDG